MPRGNLEVVMKKARSASMQNKQIHFWIIWSSWKSQCLRCLPLGIQIFVHRTTARAPVYGRHFQACGNLITNWAQWLLLAKAKLQFCALTMALAFVEDIGVRDLVGVQSFHHDLGLRRWHNFVICTLEKNNGADNVVDIVYRWTITFIRIHVSRTI